MKFASYFVRKNVTKMVCPLLTGNFNVQCDIEYYFAKAIPLALPDSFVSVIVYWALAFLKHYFCDDSHYVYVSG